MGSNVHTICLLIGIDSVPIWFAEVMNRCIKQTNAEVALAVSVTRPVSKTPGTGGNGLLHNLYQTKTAVVGDSQDSTPIDSLCCISDAERIRY